MTPTISFPAQETATEEVRQIVRLTLRDIGQFGPNPVTFSFSQATLITGENFLGKTTILKTILCLQDDHNPDLIRKGCDEGYVKAEYSDGLLVEQTITRAGSDFKIVYSDGRKVKKSPKAFLREMAAGFAIDPMRLVREKDKQKRKSFLQSLLPLSFTRAELQPICGGIRLNAEYNLDEFDQLVEGVREARKEQGRIVDSHTAILAEHERTLPAKDDTDWQAELATANQALTDLRLASQRELGERKLAHEQTANAVRETHAQRIRSIEQIRDEEIARIMTEAQKAIDKEKFSESSTLADAQTLLAEETAEITSRYAPQLEAAAAKVATSEAGFRGQEQLIGIYQLMEKTRKQIESEGVKWSLLQDRVKALENLRNIKLAAMPIKGIEIHDTKIICDGLDFDTQLSGAEQIICAARICTLAAGGLPLMVFDEAEKMGVCLNDLIAHAKKNGAQIILTKVVHGQQVLQVEAA